MVFEGKNIESNTNKATTKAGKQAFLSQDSKNVSQSGKKKASF